MEYSVDEKQIQRDLKNLIDMGGLHKGYAKMAAKAAATVVDDAARKGYKREYTRGSPGNRSGFKGSSDTHIYGNMLTRVSRKIYIARPRWRNWAAKKSSLRWGQKKQNKKEFWFRSMIRRSADGRGNPSTLSHLIEDGARHFRNGRKNFAHEIRREAFRRNRTKALKVLENGIGLAFQNATTATKMGLVNFRKNVQP